MSPVLVSTLARIVSVLVLAALAVGLPQKLVVCTPDGGRAHVEVHCGGDCHDHALQAAIGTAAGTAVDPVDHRDQDDGHARGPGDDLPVAHTPGGGCTHVALGVELAPAPEAAPFSIDQPLTADCALALPPATAPPACRLRDRHPTGPPGEPRALRDRRVTELRE